MGCKTTEQLIIDSIMKNKMSDVEFNKYVKNRIPSIRTRLNDKIHDKLVCVNMVNDRLVLSVGGKTLKYNVNPLNEIMTIHNINLEDELVSMLSYDLNMLLKEA